MSKAMSLTVEKPRLSAKTQTLAAITAVIAAVALPQLCHFIGSATGHGTAVGETLLPMHLPIILVGLLAGPWAGVVAGALSPLISFALSGMPSSVMLPFMMIELAVYGLVGGLLREVKMPTIAKVLIIQISGRAVRAAAILLSVYAFGNSSIQTAVIWNSIRTGLPGLIIQWILLPVIVYFVERNYEK